MGRGERAFFRKCFRGPYHSSLVRLLFFQAQVKAQAQGQDRLTEEDVDIIVAWQSTSQREAQTSQAQAWPRTREGQDKHQAKNKTG